MEITFYGFGRRSWTFWNYPWNKCDLLHHMYFNMSNMCETTASYMNDMTFQVWHNGPMLPILSWSPIRHRLSPIYNVNMQVTTFDIGTQWTIFKNRHYKCEDQCFNTGLMCFENMCIKVEISDLNLLGSWLNFRKFSHETTGGRLLCCNYIICIVPSLEMSSNTGIWNAIFWAVL